MNNIKSRNNSIDIFRYICAIMVVAIHTCPFEDINKELGYFVVQIIPRIAVPFFFCVSGYFYISSLVKGRKIFVTYIKRLLFVYVSWSILYYIIDFIQQVIINKGQLMDFAKNCIKTFFITGSCYHFWYFPAIIFAVCAVTFMHKIKCIKLLIPLSVILYLIGCFGESYYKIGANILILNKVYALSFFSTIRRVLLMGFPFFGSGYLVYLIRQKKEFKLSVASIVITITLFIAEIYVIRSIGLQRSVIITPFLYLLLCNTLILLLQNPKQELESLSNKCRLLANFTYYSHPLFIMLFSLFGISKTALFITVCLATFVLGIVIYKIDNKVINRFIN